MKQIKIAFSGMGGHFNPENNFIINILKKHYEVELSNSPDYLFYSVNSSDCLDYDCIRIYYTAENLVPDFNICDYAIGYHYLEFGDRYIRYPVYLVDGFEAYKGDDYLNDLVRAFHKHNHSYYKKTEFCSFVYSNAEAVECRQKIFNALSEYKRVNSGGKYLNNIGGVVANKLDFQQKHKFVIAFENTSTPGYTTEKIVHAFSANAIPIYWGNPQIAREFNEKAFINCHKYGLTEKGEADAINRIVEKVKYLDCNDSLYLQKIQAPAFTAENDIYDSRKKFELFLLNIFNQEKESAYRRNRFYWGERYERKQRIGNRFYWQCRKLIPIRDFLRKVRGK